MMMQKSNEKNLDYIISDMIEVVENSKNEIFNISEEAHKEHITLLEELVDIKDKVISHIEEGDALEKKVMLSRQRLSVVSKNFNEYTEEEIRKVYETTHDMQTDLIVIRQEEKALRERRDDLERRLVALNETVEKATSLAGKTTIVLNYLTEDFSKMNDIIEDAKEKKEYTLQSIEIQEEERKRISRDIHDGPAQMLANLLLHTEVLDRVVRKGTIEEATREIKHVREMVRSSLHEVRYIIYDLRPMAIDDLGLIPTIKKYINTTSDYQKIKIEFTSLGLEKRLLQKYEIAFFRLMQESIQNAIKHSEATLIKVKLEINDTYVTMVIEDNGKGFNLSEKRDHSFGLVGMRERVEMLEGELEIKSSKEKGTRIYIHVPYPKDVNLHTGSVNEIKA